MSAYLLALGMTVVVEAPIVALAYGRAGAEGGCAGRGVAGEALAGRAGAVGVLAGGECAGVECAGVECADRAGAGRACAGRMCMSRVCMSRVDADRASRACAAAVCVNLVSHPLVGLGICDWAGAEIGVVGFEMLALWAVLEMGAFRAFGVAVIANAVSAGMGLAFAFAPALVRTAA